MIEHREWCEEGLEILHPTKDLVRIGVCTCERRDGERRHPKIESWLMSQKPNRRQADRRKRDD